MKILHVTAGIQETCGVSCFVMETVRAQMALGHDVCVVTTMTCGYPLGEVDVRLMDEPTQVQFTPDVVHLHCIWNRYVHKMAAWCRKRGIPYVISPHGTLTPWALRYKWWKKLPAMLLYQYRDLRSAKAFHVTAQAEVEDIRRLRLKQAVAVAPLGTDMLEECDDVHSSNDILFVGRLHAVKNLNTLLRAWKQIPIDIRHGWRIVIAGPDDVGYQSELKTLATELGLSVRDFSGELEFGKKQVHGGKEVPLAIYQEKLSQRNADVVFTGPVYAETKAWLYRQSRYFVLPSHSENFGVVVIEALAAGTPCITTKGTPWKELTQNGCGWWVADELQAIRDALLNAIELDNDCYKTMTKQARELVLRKCSWRSTAETLLQLYKSL